jgi:ABC-2 type transport system permease protein
MQPKAWAIVSLLLMTVAATGGGVVLALVRCSLLFVLAVLGVIPFCAMGLLVGSLCKASAAHAVLNLFYLPMSFLSGLCLPLSLPPHPLAQLAALWQSWHVAQIVGAVTGAGPGSGHVLILASMAAACSVAARRALGGSR